MAIEAEPAAEGMSEIDKIGVIAGDVWNYLSEKGGQVDVKEVYQNLPTGATEYEVCMALGWLAREDKIHIERTNKTCTISLK